jgi:hypothetical protein
VGSPVAFFGSLGLPLMALAFRSTGGALARLWRRQDLSTVWLVLAAVVPGAVCSIIGHPRAEVEHVFLLYVPLTVTAVAACARRWYGRDAAWLTRFAWPLLVAQSILIEIFTEPYW